MLLENNEKVL